MQAIIFTSVLLVFLALTFAAWVRYRGVASGKTARPKPDTCPYSLTEVFGPDHLLNVRHQKGIRWLTDVFSRSAAKFPDQIALQIPHTGESFTYAELDSRAENIAVEISRYLSGPDQVVAVAMPQDNWQIVASHLAILKAGGTLMFLDTTLPDALITHMLADAEPVLVLTRGERRFRGLPTLDVLDMPLSSRRVETPSWMDDPAERLATIFYTSGTTGMPRGVECPHAGYVNLALSYADYFDLIPGMDATSLTSSLGYDGSISEMYSAWVSGCTVVLLTKDQIRSGPELLPVLRDAEVTVLFCPPVLLTTLTPTPETDLPYPICRYIVPAGEAFPNALVEPWTRNRRQIINTYGPTEASTDTSRQSLRPGEPITIGSPFPNVTYVILEIDGMQPLKHGEAGELCIGGIHVGRGYRNVPEQTISKFITHPTFGRLYRTGDRCVIDPATHRVHFLGRIDAQLKVRGHRVEAQAVEDILQTQFSEIEAAVLDYQNNALVAFVSAPRVYGDAITDVVAAPAAWANNVTAALARQLPEPSVPSRIFLVEKFTMKPVSGKIDRKRMPDLSDLLQSGAAERTHGSDDPDLKTPHTATPDPPTAECKQVLEICRTIFDTPLGVDDEFAVSGGHSIAIARLAQKLHSAGWQISVRALLSDCNTVRKVASRPRIDEVAAGTPQRANTDKEPMPRDEAAAEVLSVRRFTILQVLFSLFQYSPAIVAFLLAMDTAADGLDVMTAGLSEYLVGGLALYLAVLALPFGALVWAMLIKSFIGGDVYANNITPGVYPKWSKMHLRLWCIQRLETMVLIPMSALYRSAPLRAFALRQLGAKVGKNLQCAQDSVLTGPLDLFTIEDDVAIQTGAYLQTTRWSGQFFEVGPIHLENGCKIGMRASIANNVSVGSGTWVTPFTPILSDVGHGEVWEGSPARLTGRCMPLKRTAKACEYSRPIWMLETANIIMQICVSFAISVTPVAAILWVVGTYILPTEVSTFGPDLRQGPFAELAWHLVLYTFVTAWVTIVISSVLGCIFIRLTAASPGLYPSRGLRAALLMYRMRKMNTIQTQWTWTITGQYLRALAGMRFNRIGASECDVMHDLVPELATADAQVFWSNSCFTNMLDYGAEHITLRQLDMPQHFFTGNNCVAEYGHFPPNFLLGVSTPVSEINFRRQMNSREGAQITVAGNPPMRFASSRPVDESAGGVVSFPLFLARVFLNDVFSIGMIPVTAELIFGMFYIYLSGTLDDPVVEALAALIAAEACVMALCILLKRSIVGSRWGADHSTPFWSLRHFAYFFAQDCFFVWCREPLRLLAGTTAANWILRRMGCNIGKRTIVTDPMQCFDWNAVSFGNDCYVDGYLQFHTFEDLKLKVKKATIGDGCAVNAGATIMGGAVIEKDSTLLPLSMVLKEVNLPTSTYEGSPAEPVRDPEAAALRDPGKAYSKFADTAVSRIIDNTDWLKTAAIILVFVDHIGYFFIRDDHWWSVFGRMAAPSFFFLIGYAHTRSVPLQWIMLGVILTVLDSANNDWQWVAPNILLSFALIRLMRPYWVKFVEGYGIAAYIVLAAAFVALMPVGAKLIDYGTEGWLWALVGMSQRLRSDAKMSGTNSRGTNLKNVIASVVVCLVAASAYVMGEQNEFHFTAAQFNTFVGCLAVLAAAFCVFARGNSRIKPPAPIAAGMRFIGRNTLVIYALELIVFELAIKLFPGISF